MAVDTKNERHFMQPVVSINNLSRTYAGGFQALETVITNVPEALASWDLELMAEGDKLTYIYDPHKAHTGMHELLQAIHAAGLVIKDMQMVFLGGTFYSVDMLLPAWQTVTLFNPVAYLISEFRWSFFEVADVSVGLSLTVMLGFLVLCMTIVWWMFRTGYRLKQ